MTTIRIKNCSLNFKRNMQLAYIQARNNTQAIITNALDNIGNKVRVVGTFSLAEHKSNFLFGCHFGGETFAVMDSNNGSLSVWGASGSSAVTMGTTVSAIPLDTEFVIDVSNNAMVINNEALTPTGNGAIVGHFSKGFGLLGYTGSTNGANTGVRLKNIKIYSDYEDTSSLVVDAVPVKRETDNKVCLFDKVTRTYLFTNDSENPLFE